MSATLQPHDLPDPDGPAREPADRDSADGVLSFAAFHEAVGHAVAAHREATRPRDTLAQRQAGEHAARIGDALAWTEFQVDRVARRWREGAGAGRCDAGEADLAEVLDVLGDVLQAVAWLQRTTCEALRERAGGSHR